MVYAIDRSICNGCDACSSTCPTHAISHDVKAEKNSIDPEYCVSCNLCSSFCERNAIRKEDGSFTPRIVRSGKLSVPSPICICAPSEQKVVIYYFSPNKGQYIFHLQELSLVHAFHDFLVYLPESSMVYSEEESKELLHSVYEKYKNLYN